MLCGWEGMNLYILAQYDSEVHGEGNRRRSGVALAMRYSLSVSVYPLAGSVGLCNGDEHPAYTPSGVCPLCLHVITELRIRHSLSRGVFTKV